MRLDAPLGVSYFSEDGSRVSTATTKNISADGLSFRTLDKGIKESSPIEIKLSIDGAANPIHARARVVWKRRVSLEDGSPFDIGLEFTDIEEDNKNSFLKSLCDLMYKISEDRSTKDR